MMVAAGEPKKEVATASNVEYLVEEVESKVIAAKPGRYYGRCALVEVPSVPPAWILFYHEASHHWKCKDGVMHVRFSQIIAHAIDLTYKHNIQRVSFDMGVTWTDTQTPTYGAGGSVVSMHRQRLRTSRHIRGEKEWWADPVLVVASNANIFHQNRNPRRRRNGVFISPDRGKTWQRPQWLDVETEDAGYGDTSWDPEGGKYVAWLYHGRNGEAVLKQYKFAVRAKARNNHHSSIANQPMPAGSAESGVVGGDDYTGGIHRCRIAPDPSRQLRDFSTKGR
jgi:hypothetical protein